MKFRVFIRLPALEKCWLIHTTGIVAPMEIHKRPTEKSRIVHLKGFHKVVELLVSHVSQLRLIFFIEKCGVVGFSRWIILSSFHMTKVVKNPERTGMVALAG